MSTDAINRTITDKDGVEVTVGPEDGSNNVPLADWGTTYRPTPDSVTDFLGADAHNETTPQSAPQDVLPAQGFVPPSNHFGEDLTLDDRDLSDLRTQLVVIADTTTPTTMGAVSVPLEDMNYDPEEVAGDVIPDRDKPEDSGGGEEVPPDGGETPPDGENGGEEVPPEDSPGTGPTTPSSPGNTSSGGPSSPLPEQGDQSTEPPL